MNSSGHRPADSLSPSLDSREHPANPPCRRQTNRSRLNQQTRPAPRRLVCLSGASLRLVFAFRVLHQLTPALLQMARCLRKVSTRLADPLAANRGTTLEQAVTDPLPTPSGSSFPSTSAGTRTSMRHGVRLLSYPCALDLNIARRLVADLAPKNRVRRRAVSAAAVGRRAIVKKGVPDIHRRRLELTAV